MASRYKVTGSWSVDKSVTDTITILSADITDTRTGDTFREGAFYVTQAKPGTKGSKGKPFFGECAWMDAERLANDLAMAERYGVRS